MSVVYVGAVVVPPDALEARVSQVFAEVVVGVSGGTTSVVDTESWHAYGPSAGASANQAETGYRGWDLPGTAAFGYSAGFYTGTFAVGGGFNNQFTKTLASPCTAIGFYCNPTNRGANLCGFSDALGNPTSPACFLHVGVPLPGNLILSYNGVDHDSGVAFVGGGWHYVELVHDNASTSIYLYIDGVLKLTVAAADSWSFSEASFVTTTSCSFSDIYFGVGDSAGSPIGPARVECLMPSADGSNSGFTPSSGTAHYSLVNERPDDGLTSYVHASAVGSTDTYDVTSLVSTTGTIRGVNVVAIADADATGTRALAPVVLSTGTLLAGIATTLPVGSVSTFSPTGVQAIFSVDPHTSAAWTIANVNAAQVGMKVTT